MPWGWASTSTSAAWYGARQRHGVAPTPLQLRALPLPNGPSLAAAATRAQSCEPAFPAFRKWQGGARASATPRRLLPLAEKQVFHGLTRPESKMTRVPLLPSEVKQIAGRAGRRGSRRGLACWRTGGLADAQGHGTSAGVGAGAGARCGARLAPTEHARKCWLCEGAGCLRGRAEPSALGALAGALPRRWGTSGLVTTFFKEDLGDLAAALAAPTTPATAAGVLPTLEQARRSHGPRRGGQRRSALVCLGALSAGRAAGPRNPPSKLAPALQPSRARALRWRPRPCPCPCRCRC